jgi:YtoQ family protein
LARPQGSWRQRDPHSNPDPRADVVIVRFGEKYRQWNAAFDAGFAAALGKPIVTLHDDELDHALKEVDRAAQANARSAEQVVDVLRYVIRGQLP